MNEAIILLLKLMSEKASIAERIRERHQELLHITEKFPTNKNIQEWGNVVNMLINRQQDSVQACAKSTMQVVIRPMIKST